MKTFSRKTILPLFILLLACNGNTTSKHAEVITKSENSQEEKVILKNDFENNLFITAASLDDNGDLELGCDCCSSNFYFLDKNKFIEVAYCLHNDSYLKGKYEIVEEGILLHYNQEYLTIESNLEIDSDSTETWKDKYIYTKSEKPASVSWKRNKSNPIFKTSFGEFVKMDKSKTEFLKRISADKEIKAFLGM